MQPVECVIALRCKDETGKLVAVKSVFCGNWSAEDLQIAMVELRRGYAMYQGERLHAMEKAKIDEARAAEIKVKRQGIAAAAREKLKAKREAEKEKSLEAGEAAA